MLEDIEQQDVKFPAAKPATASAADLSAQVASEVERQPGDVVRCTRVGLDGYRCNWWSVLDTKAYDNPSMNGLMVTTHRVRQSQFLRVTKTNSGKLQIRICSDLPVPE